MQLETALLWGDQFRRRVMAAAALVGIYSVRELAHKTRTSEGAINGWWHGAKPSPETLARIAEATGLSLAELTQWVYFGGPPPTLPL